MTQNKNPEQVLPEPIVDYIVHHYGLTREQARGLVEQSAGDQTLIDAKAGRLKAQRRS